MKIFLIMFLLSMSVYASIGTVMILKGGATITRSKNIVDVKVGDDIEEGDEVKTSNSSRMQVMLNDDTIVTLGQNTEYIFNSYNDDNDPHAEMTLISGFLKTVTGKIGQIAPERFKLKTRSATIGIRGTGWMTYIGLNIENTVCFRGSIYVMTKDKVFDIPAGYMILITDKIPKKYKTDMKFFKDQIKKVEAKSKSSNKNPKIDNTPPKVEPEPLKEVLFKKGNLLEMTKDIENEVINDAVYKDLEGGTLPPSNTPGDDPTYPTGGSNF